MEPAGSSGCTTPGSLNMLKPGCAHEGLPALQQAHYLPPVDSEFSAVACTRYCSLAETAARAVFPAINATLGLGSRGGSVVVASGLSEAGRTSSKRGRWRYRRGRSGRGARCAAEPQAHSGCGSGRLLVLSDEGRLPRRGGSFRE
jgi:hypothetical protein